MFLQSGKDAAARVAGIIQEKYQVHRYTVDLTVKSISEVDPVGRLDFGGGEYVSAGHFSISPARVRREDRYKWWDLGRGCYFIEFNETLDLGEDEIALLEPDARLLRTGGSHATVFLRGHTDPVEMLIYVAVPRLQVKQNARISHIRLFRLSGVSAARPAKRNAAKKRIRARR